MGMEEAGHYGSMEQNENEVEEEVYHYEAHESLEDEQFELHTHAKKDLAHDQSDPYKFGDGKELVGIEDLFLEQQNIIDEVISVQTPQQKTTSSEILIMAVDEQADGEDEVLLVDKKSKSFEGALDGVAVEAKCATSNESSEDSRGNKDLLGMMNEELANETELMYEE